MDTDPFLNSPSTHRHYERVAKAIRYLRAHAGAQPSLEELAQAMHLSPYHAQKLFTQWAGVSPKRYLQFLSKEHAKACLRSSNSLLNVTHELGLSSTSRLHDLMVSCEAMTPAEYQSGARGLPWAYGVAESPFGLALLAWTGRGICHFTFVQGDETEGITELMTLWPQVRWQRSDTEARVQMGLIFPGSAVAAEGGLVDGDPNLTGEADEPQPARVHVLLKGTNFQIKVWEALIQTTSKGDMLTYQQLAHRMGSPKASRAVGSAMAANTIGYLIPCHRVIREGGDVGHYRWGSERKLAMLGWEAASRQA